MNSLVEGIVFTTETCLDFKNEWGLPTIDFMWKMMESDGGARKVGYKFYKKGVSTNLVTPYKSAQAINGKIASLSQDMFRIMANCNVEVTMNKKVEMIMETP